MADTPSSRALGRSRGRDAAGALAAGGWPDVADRRHLAGAASLRRVGRMRFPVHELTHEGDVVASLGRFGWFSIFLGSGQEIGFPDGERWRLGSVRHGGSICPIVIDGRGRRVAVARLGIRNYGINGKDYACVLIPAEPDRIGRANRWTLHYFEHELATVTRRPLTIETYHAVPLGAVFLCFVLARYPLPEEAAPRLPSFRWR